MRGDRTQLTYQEFVDSMAAISKQSVSINRIVSHGHSERTNDAALPLDANELAKKDFCESLSYQQRDALVHLLLDERLAAIHDALAYLEWAVTSGRIEISGSGGSFADITRETIHGDFISRWSGKDW